MDRELATTSTLTDPEIVSVVTDDGDEAEDGEEEEEEVNRTVHKFSTVQCLFKQAGIFLTCMMKREKQKTELKKSDLFKLLTDHSPVLR